MAAEPVNIFSTGISNIAAVLPAVIGALIVLLVGWIAGRLLGKAVRVVCDRASSVPLIGESEVGKTVTTTGFSVGYIADIFIRIIVYLVAILAAVDILNMEYMSKLMTTIVEYIPHVVAFIIILIVGFLLADYFIDFLAKYYAKQDIQLINPVLFLMRIFLYFVIAVLALSQLMLDLTIIYTFVTPVAWGIGLGLGAAIAIIVGFGLKNRSEAIMDKVIDSIAVKKQ